MSVFNPDETGSDRLDISLTVPVLLTNTNVDLAHLTQEQLTLTEVFHAGIMDSSDDGIMKHLQLTSLFCTSTELCL